MSHISTEERTALRERHSDIFGYEREGKTTSWCTGCQEFNIPCSTIRLLDDLERAERERDEASVLTAWHSGYLLGDDERIFAFLGENWVKKDRHVIDYGCALVEGGSHE